MEIRLRPELEELIKRDLARGPYSTVEECVEHAVTLLHEEESWLAEHGSDIDAQIESGYAAAEYGREPTLFRWSPTSDGRAVAPHFKVCG